MTSQDPGDGASAFTEMCRKKALADLAWQTRPTPAYECPMTHMAEEPVQIPKLLRAYLAVGGKICGPPALDRQFKTIDFLTLVDLRDLPDGTRERFLG